MAAEVGYHEAALDYFRQALYIDLLDLHGNTVDGLHVASSGGVWQALVHGFAGLRDHGGRMSFDPRLPDGWRCRPVPPRLAGARHRGGGDARRPGPGGGGPRRHRRHRPARRGRAGIDRADAPRGHGARRAPRRTPGTSVSIPLDAHGPGSPAGSPPARAPAGPHRRQQDHRRRPRPRTSSRTGRRLVCCRWFRRSSRTKVSTRTPITHLSSQPGLTQPVVMHRPRC